MIAPVTAATDSAVRRPRGAQELRCRHASWSRELHRPRPRAGKLCWRTSEREEHRRPLGTSPARSPRPRRRPPASVPRKTPSLSTLAEDYFKDNSNAAPCEPVAGEGSSPAVLEEEALRELVLGAGVARRRLRATGSHWPLHGPAMASAGFGLASTGSRPGRQAPPATGTAGSSLAGHQSGLRRRGQGRGWSRRRRCSDEQSRRGVDVVVKLYRTELPASGRHRLRRPQRQS